MSKSHLIKVYSVGLKIKLFASGYSWLKPDFQGRYWIQTDATQHVAQD